MVKYFISIAEKNKKDMNVDKTAIRFLVWNSIPVWVFSSITLSIDNLLIGVILSTFVIMPIYFFMLYIKCKNR